MLLKNHRSLLSENRLNQSESLPNDPFNRPMNNQTANKSSFQIVNNRPKSPNAYYVAHSTKSNIRTNTHTEPVNHLSTQNLTNPNQVNFQKPQTQNQQQPFSQRQTRPKMTRRIQLSPSPVKYKDFRPIIINPSLSPMIKRASKPWKTLITTNRKLTTDSPMTTSQTSRSVYSNNNGPTIVRRSVSPNSMTAKNYQQSYQPVQNNSAFSYRVSPSPTRVIRLGNSRSYDKKPFFLKKHVAADATSIRKLQTNADLLNMEVPETVGEVPIVQLEKAKEYSSLANSPTFVIPKAQIAELNRKRSTLWNSNQDNVHLGTYSNHTFDKMRFGNANSRSDRFNSNRN